MRKIRHIKLGTDLFAILTILALAMVAANWPVSQLVSGVLFLTFFLSYLILDRKLVSLQEEESFRMNKAYFELRNQGFEEGQNFPKAKNIRHKKESGQVINVDFKNKKRA